MRYKSYSELIYKLQSVKEKKRVVVVCSEGAHTLEAVFKAYNDGIVTPILVGDKEKTIKILEDLNFNYDNIPIYDEKNVVMSAKKAVSLINEGKADFMIKGKIKTAELLRVIVKKDEGLRTNNIMSHISMFEVPKYHKLLFVSDSGMNPEPDLEMKKEIIKNVIAFAEKIGVEMPKVAVLSSAEVVNEKVKESLEAEKIKEMYLNGEFKNCILESPISFDLAINKESAKIKDYKSPVTGDADILICPDLVSGNLMSKSMIQFGGAVMTGLIYGAKVPVVLTSRSASTKEKYLSLVIAAMVS